MADFSIHKVYQAVTVAKLTYMQQASGGVLLPAVDRQRLEAVIPLGGADLRFNSPRQTPAEAASQMCSSDLLAIAELVDCADDCSTKFWTTRTTFCTIQCQMKQCLLMHLDADLTVEN